MKYIIGSFLIIIGFIFILQGFNFDLLFRIGVNFVKFWPIILIMIGLSILSKNVKWLKFLNMDVCVIFLLLLFFWNYNTTFVNFSESYTDYEKIYINILPDKNVMDLYFDIPTISLDISVDENSEAISCYYYGPQELNVSQKNGYVRFERFNKKNFPINGYKVYLILPTDYVFNIYVSSGLTNIAIKESINVIRNFEVNSGIIKLNGEIKDFKENLFLNISGGISRINFLLSKNTTYFLDYEGGIKNISVGNDLIKDLNGVLHLVIDSGILSVNLKTE